MKKAIKWIVVVGACLFLIAQVVRPARTNPPVDQPLTVEAYTHPDSAVQGILDRSCVDCHSYKTRWPWYTNVAPVSWFIVNHVNDARRDMNLSEWGKYDARQQDAKLRQMCGEVKSGDMPLNTYTPLHKGSSLSAADVQLLCDWTTRERTALAAH